ncbi:MAG TPA: TlpA disulfide reductase family protein, partial [Actinomycetota bacterium]|nr:TlpA disulfide reductase family protein [Actinomycetota bacterium]
AASALGLSGRREGGTGPAARSGPAGSGAVLGSSLGPGDRFPAFRLVDADGRRVSNRTLAGEPTLVWFTTSYCVPCQVGARRVAGLDDALGGDAFRVLVVFVDPTEPTSALRSWRSRFGRDDWLLVEDVGLARVVGLRFLDTKFLLDRAGVIRDIDVRIADDAYLERIRELVAAG